MHTPGDDPQVRRSSAAGIPRRRVLQGGGGMAAGALMPGLGKVLNAAGGPGSAGRAAPEPVSVTVSAAARGPVIGSDFAGLGFERGALIPGNHNVTGYFLSPSNTEAVTLVRNAGVRSVRIGGNTVDQDPVAGTGADGFAGVDALFEFAAAAGVSVIYSLRLSDPASSPVPGLMAQDVAAAQYIWARYRHLLSSFSIGNEPDWHSYHIVDPLIFETIAGEPGTAYPSYLADWRSYAAALHQAVPAARISGPDTGNYGTLSGLPYVTFTPDPSGASWTQQFTTDIASSGLISGANQHYYVGGSPFDTTGPQAIANMLSGDWAEQTQIGQQPTGTSSGDTTAYVPYPWLYDTIIAPTVAAGLPVRLTELNDYVTGISGASDAFAAALWALDFLHWWVSHGVTGVNFHNNQWIYTDTIAPGIGSYDPATGTCSAPGCGNYRVTPKGYAIKAFSLGARGEAKPAAVAKPADLNLTAHAAGDGASLYVTIINKTYGSAARDAQVTIEPQDFPAAAAASIVLDAGEPGDPSSLTATLGGAAISNSAPWPGRWTPLRTDRRGTVTVTARATTAVVVRIHR